MANVAKHVGCKVNGCDKPHRARGLCKTHYMRFNRTGSPHLDGRTSPARKKTTAAGNETSRPSPRNDLVDVPKYGTLTLEQWKRLRSEPAADVHVVQRQVHATGVIA